MLACTYCHDGLHNPDMIPLAIPCGHIFCSQCIESWQEDFQVGEGFSTCPKCSRGFRQTDIVKLFLPPNMEESVASTSRTPVSPEGVTPEPVINDAKTDLERVSTSLYNLRSQLKYANILTQAKADEISLWKKVTELREDVQEAVFDQGNLIGEARKSEELSRTTEEQLNMWLERETGWKERDRRWKARWEKNEDVRCKEKLKLQSTIANIMYKERQVKDAYKKSFAKMTKYRRHYASTKQKLETLKLISSPGQPDTTVSDIRSWGGFSSAPLDLSLRPAGVKRKNEEAWYDSDKMDEEPESSQATVFGYGEEMEGVDSQAGVVS